MSQVRPGDAPQVHGLIGIGFGPSNGAMAIAIAEHNAGAGAHEPVTARFFEQQPRFGWHRGMLIDDATMQVSFLKDLVTLRNPEGVERGDRVRHNSDLPAKADGLKGTSPSRFVVVGAGRSAAENVACLHRRFPEAEVRAVFSRYGYTPADHSSFANRIFGPGAVDEYFAAPGSVKRRVTDYHGNTHYSVVDIDLIDDLYRKTYQEKVLGTERLRFLNVSRLAAVEEARSGWSRRAPPARPHGFASRPAPGAQLPIRTA